VNFKSFSAFGRRRVPRPLARALPWIPVRDSVLQTFYTAPRFSHTAYTTLTVDHWFVERAKIIQLKYAFANLRIWKKMLFECSPASPVYFSTREYVWQW